MTSSIRAERLPLTGADCFLRAFDAETRRLCGASHLSQLVLRLGPGFDVDALERAIRQASQASPILTAPIRRRFGVGLPAFDLRGRGQGPLPIVERHRGAPMEAGSGAEAPPIPMLFFERLNGLHALRRGELLRFDLVEYAEGPVRTDLAMTWSHMLLDGNGSERFVEALAALAGSASGPRLEADGDGGEPLLPKRPLAEQGQLARTWLDEMNAMGTRPPRSLAGPPTRVRQQLRYDLLALDAERSAGVQQRARELAGFLTPVAFYMAAAIRAHHAVFQQRGEVPESYVVPLPVNLRRRGEIGPIFQTRISMLWFQVLPESVDDLTALIQSIKDQRLGAIKSGAIERTAAALDLIRVLPARAYARLARSTFDGEVASFLFAFTDAFLPELGEFCGAPVIDGFHAPSVTPSPGSAAIMSLRDGRLNVTHVHQRGVFDDRELAIFRDQLLADLEGRAP